MAYALTLSRRAERYFLRLDPRSQARVADRLEAIVQDPYGSGTKPLQNSAGRRAARVGGLRIIFAVDDVGHAIEIGDIAPRGQVYRRL